MDNKLFDFVTDVIDEIAYMELERVIAWLFGVIGVLLFLLVVLILFV